MKSYNEDSVSVYMRRDSSEPPPQLGDRVTIAVAGMCVQATCEAVQSYESFWSARFSATFPECVVNPTYGAKVGAK